MSNEVLYSAIKNRVIQELEAVFEILAEEHTKKAIKRIKGGHYNSLIKESLSSSVLEIAETIMDLEQLEANKK
jgi:hypothetical protein